MESVGLNEGFWRDRRVLLTGHTGFKGSWLLLLLEHFGARVTGVSLEPETNALFVQVNGAARCHHLACDIRDGDALAAIVRQANPELILHLAAQPLVRQSYLDPVETFSTNVQGTVNLLNAARDLKALRAIVSVTTDKCYANDGRQTGYREDDRLGGHDPYSNSKACAELATQCFRDSFFASRGVGVATARAGNVIGGGDYAADRLIPDVVRALGEGRRPELRNPSAIRPWQHVLDPVFGYALLAEKLAENPKAFAKGWNFGPPNDERASVAAVVGQMAQHWGKNGDFLPQPGDHPHEAGVLTLDAGLARRELGWSPRLPLKSAVDWTAEWYRASEHGADAAQLCASQIDHYLIGNAVQAAA